ncbi:LiaF transmembrane domain-containing protein [Paenibacillus glycanilyticus]|uniref:LiaF transmembrane domain-containing protein n=1 Tax=Paenibacillus glycanilyticus TaxID=126569 RepID=A0ABQ6GBQ7_9BACL|nr:hypothetical protein [Paenibacillus glycanilyticus]GLX67480.1 hypothetical protein MU1_18250 [Paenibacillus glycanilyticus]
MDGKKALGLLLAIAGGILVLKFFGIHLGFLFGTLFAIALVGLGVVAWRSNRKIIGAIVGGIGILMLLPALSKLIMLGIAVVLIIFGISMVKKNNNNRHF